MPLSIAPMGLPVKIVKITADEKTRRHLENLGIIVGTEIHPVSGSGGNVIVKVKEGRLALGRDLAMKILVA